ncbi:MAG TPA: DUF4197 domain-containing protein [bacterium]|nr:DUF4197 domain-containing protein [bacterium]HPN33955.1 DUF4197 domain-containing protein [bacterium]
MKKILVLVLAVSCLVLVSCAEMAAILPELATAVSGGGLTTEEIIAGLKEALVVGAINSTGQASKTDGFHLNSAIKIPFPLEAIKMKNTLEKAGFGGLVADFEKSLNRAAEEASKKALPIFKDAITSMTITDAANILSGADSAATFYLKTKTSSALFAEFTPVVQNALNTVEVTKYWKPLASAYNQLSVLTGAKAVNPDLDAYVTQEALDGLFYLIGQEEKKIRQDPAARVTELLKKVFGSQS